MAEGHIVWQKCPDCDGTGINERFASDQYGTGELIDDTCVKCSGSKYVVWGWWSKEEMEIPDFLPTGE